MEEEHAGNHMIYGTLANINGESTFLPPAIVKSLEYLRQCDFSKLENKKYEIDGENIFMILNEYETKNITDKKGEQHRVYIDLHYIISGQEMIGWGQTHAENEIIDQYDPVKERTSFRVVKDEVYIPLRPGFVALFFPSDIHRPELNYDTVHTVRKAVIKIKADIC